MLFYEILASTIHEKAQKYKSNAFKISAPAWNGKFELSDGSYSLSDISSKNMEQ